MAELDERAAAQHAPTVEGVTLASLHAAKGLEWDAVFLVGLTEGMLPITYAETAEQVEEERRLLYVGVTRARAAPDAVLGARRARPAAGRAAGPRGSSTGCTRGSAHAGGRRPARGRGRTAGPAAVPRLRHGADGAGRERKLGRCEDCPSTYDEALFERLRDWRAEQAQAASVPAYCVFTDATLTGDRRGAPDDGARAAGRSPGIGPHQAATGTAPTCWPCVRARIRRPGQPKITIRSTRRQQ